MSFSKIFLNLYMELIHLFGSGQSLRVTRITSNSAALDILCLEASFSIIKVLSFTVKSAPGYNGLLPSYMSSSNSIISETYIYII